MPADIGVGERCCQSCAPDCKKNDNCPIREEHNGGGATTRVAWGKNESAQGPFNLWLYTGRVARTRSSTSRWMFGSSSRKCPCQQISTFAGVDDRITSDHSATCRLPSAFPACMLAFAMTFESHIESLSRRPATPSCDFATYGCTLAALPEPRIGPRLDEIRSR